MTTNDMKSSCDAFQYRSVEDRVIPVHVFGSGERTVMLMAGVHGDETNGVDIVASILHKLEALYAVSDSGHDNHQPSAICPCRLVVMPLCNPDGYAAGTRRNARKIDINRNFPTKDFVGEADHPGGVEATSEPETRAILEVVSHFKPCLIIPLHEALACVNWNGRSAESIAERMSAICGLPAVGDVGYPCPGSMGTYFGFERELPVITLELPKPDMLDVPSIEKAILEELGCMNI